MEPLASWVLGPIPSLLHGFLCMGHLLELPVLLVGTKRHGDASPAPAFRLDQSISAGLQPRGEEKAATSSFSSSSSSFREELPAASSTSTSPADTTSTSRAPTSAKLRTGTPTRPPNVNEVRHSPKSPAFHSTRIFPLPPLQSPLGGGSPSALHGLLHSLSHRHCGLLQHATLAHGIRHWRQSVTNQLIVDLIN